MKTQLKLIDQAFTRLEFLNHHTWTHYADNLLDQCKEEEKGHRGTGGDFAKYHPNACTITEAAKMFAVKRVAEYLTGQKMPRGRDYLHTQKSAFIAAGLVDEFRKDIRKAWRGLDVAELAALDYCKFVRPEGQP